MGLTVRFISNTLINVMITIANSVATKLTVAFVATAMMFSLVAPAQAQTAEELQAQIDTLMATITALQAQLGVEGGGSTSSSDVCPYTWTRSLNMGDTGADVMKLQQFLNAEAATRVAVSGAGSVGAETSYYGPATGAAVAKFQEMHRAAVLSPLDLVNSTTFFGNSTRAQANALCVAGTVAETEEGEEGEAEEGSVTLGNAGGSIDSISEVSAEESNLDEGQTGGVLAFEVEIEGDVEIDRIDVYLEEDASGAESNDPEDYFVEATLMVDGEEVATIDVSDFDEDDYTVVAVGGGDEQRLRFSSLGLVFENNDKPEFEVSFEVVSNIDTADLGVNWTAQLDNIRFVDGEGFTGSEVVTTVYEAFGFGTEETADLDISEASNNPEATTLKIDDGDDESDEFTVFVFEIEEENDVNTTIQEMTFTVDTQGSTTESDVIDEVILYMGSTELASESGSSSVKFENLDIVIDGNSTEEFSIAMIFRGAEDHGLVSSVEVTLTSIDEAEDANGNDEAEMNIDGETTTASEVHALRTVVPEVTATSFTTEKSENDETGVASFRFTVGAEDDDFDLVFADVDVLTGGAGDAVRYTTTGGSAVVTAAITKVSGDATPNSSTGWTIEEGDEATFVIDYNFTTASSTDNGTYRVNVDTVGGIEVDETSNGMSLSKS
jgi:peptidoglycan hydrolase-like protein with peptidoglycan-binding domain